MINQKGYKVLNHVRVIQGDGVNEDSITEIFKRVEKSCFSASNLVFGMGGALLQKLNRGTQKFAVKCSEVTVDGKAISVYKDPVTDPGKTSKKGRLALIKTEKGYETVSSSGDDQLVCVYENGKVQQEQSFEEIRQRAWSFAV